MLGSGYRDIHDIKWGEVFLRQGSWRPAFLLGNTENKKCLSIKFRHTPGGIPSGSAVTLAFPLKLRTWMSYALALPEICTKGSRQDAKS